MTPEQDIERIIRDVHPQSGHWPYTRDSDMYVGWRVGEESFSAASDRRMRVRIVYDVAIVHSYDLTQDAERLRYALYAALTAGGWKLASAPGPEATIQPHRQRMWPFSVVKSFTLEDGMPQTAGGEQA